MRSAASPGTQSEAIVLDVLRMGKVEGRQGTVMVRISQNAARTLIRAAIVTTVAGTLPSVLAQTPWLHFSLTLTEVEAGTATPVANPNGLIEPGEGVLFELASLRFEPEVGTIVQTSGGSGPVAGLFGFGAMLWGAGGAEGAWSNIYRAPAWSALGHPPYVGTGGASLGPITLGQIPFPSANPQNPIQGAFRAVWTPASYVPRTMYWIFENAAHGNFADILVQVGTDPTTGLPVYSGFSIPQASSSGNRLNEVHIVPGPSTAALIALAAAGVVHRRRRCT
jgi:uncharacterized protein (TIGR03382 family)